MVSSASFEFEFSVVFGTCEKVSYTQKKKREGEREGQAVFFRSQTF